MVELVYEVTIGYDRTLPSTTVQSCLSLSFSAAFFIVALTYGVYEATASTVPSHGR